MNESSAIRIVPGAVSKGLIPFNLYTKDSRGSLVLFCRRDYSITEKHIDALHASGQNFYVSRNEIDSFNDYSFRNIDRIIKSNDLPDEDKGHILHDVGKRIVRQMLDNPKSGLMQEDTSRFVEAEIDFILSSREASNLLFSISSADPYTLSHSINVSTFCILLGQKFFDPASEEIRQLGIGGLLHDIGKTLVDQDILFKPEILMPGEMAEVKRHAALGYDLLRGKGYSADVLAMVRNHHERADGSGYPDGLILGETHFFARICALADVYDAMTSERVYANELPVADAIEIILQETERFDTDILKALLEVIIPNKELIEHLLRKTMERGNVWENVRSPFERGNF